MSPQPSNRASLIEGTLRCLDRLPPERVTARAIAEESGANLASIAYHFGSKDELVTAAVIEGLDRWLDEIAASLGDLSDKDPGTRFRLAAEALEAGRGARLGLARNFVMALAKAQHDEEVRARLAAGYRRTRPAVAALLGLGRDRVGEEAGGLVLALFHGLLFQSLLDPGLAVEGERLQQAQARMLRALPTDAD
jgi:AcrR family transcriptional regulator